MEATINFIGIVHSPLKSLEDCPKQENEQAPEAIIEIYPKFLDGIKNIEAGSEMILLTWFHLSDRSELVCHPRDNPSAPLRGVFSTRSSNRPNPIGMHLVKILSVEENGFIKISNLEALDQTPVIDIKPVLKYI
jgi:tRNA-Thr(GGU) m(6)t(6)A37 methyltransferase TsaA